nr:uncharacterized protein LOC123002452 [Drosophila takahashii]
MSTVGSLEPYDLDDPHKWTSYKERFDIYLVDNDVKEEGRKKAVFLTLAGAPLFELLTSLASPTKFGISSAPGIFQSLIESILQNIPGVLPYFDDIIIIAKSEEELASRLNQVLSRLDHAGLRLRKDKCEFGVPTVEFLGFKIDALGIRPSISKVEAIQNAPIPKDKKGLQGFIGLVNFYHAFLPHKAIVLDQSLATQIFLAFAQFHHPKKLNLMIELAGVPARRIGLGKSSCNSSSSPRSYSDGTACASSYDCEDESHSPQLRVVANIDAEVESMVKQCKVCQQGRNEKPSTATHRWESAKYPWSRIHIDFAGPFQGKIYCLVVDSYLKWLEVAVVSSTSAAAAIKFLRQLFATHGLPDELVSDNGTAFTSEEFKLFTENNLIRHIKSAPFHPATNGQAERMV